MTAVRAVSLWEALEDSWDGDEGALVRGASARDFLGWCPHCRSRPSRTLDIAVDGQVAFVNPRCCTVADVLIALGLAEEAA